jgi:site-specific DNA-methyltransferase (adenine-specific)
MISLMLGDCLERMKDIPDGSVDLVLADPPYGTTACKWDSIIPLDRIWTELKRVIKSNGVIVMTASQPFTTVLISSNFEMFKYCWVWEKNRATNFPNAKRRPLTAHEDIVVFINGSMWYNPQKTGGHKPTNSARGVSQGTIYNGNNVRNYQGGETTRFPRTVQRVDCERGLHPTQKPVALMEYLIKTYSNEGDTVLDFTMGSGTTGVACVNTNRNFIGIEMDEKYFAIAKKRINETEK